MRAFVGSTGGAFVVRNLPTDAWHQPTLGDVQARTFDVTDALSGHVAARLALCEMMRRGCPAEVVYVEGLTAQEVAGRLDVFGELVAWCDRDVYGTEHPAEVPQ